MTKRYLRNRLPRSESEKERERLRAPRYHPVESPERSPVSHPFPDSLEGGRGSAGYAMILSDPRLSRSTAISARQHLVEALQRAYGNRYFQRVMDRVRANAMIQDPGNGLACARAIEAKPTVRAVIGVPIEREPLETRAPAVRPGVYWGRLSESTSGWAAADVPRAEVSPWAARTVANPAPVWGEGDRGAMVPESRGKAGPMAIVNPALNTLKFLESTYGQNTFGVAPWPTNFTTPRYVIAPVPHHTPEMIAKKTPPQWYGVPVLLSKAYEGDSQPYYLGPGEHLSAFKEKGVDRYYNISNTISQRDHDAELEHANDFKYAFDISLKEAESVLLKHVEGKKFGPKASPAEIEQMVKDTIRSHLTHPQLGEDQTMWGAKYETLQKKSLNRDQKGWHTFWISNRKEVKDKKGTVTKITYDVTKGTTKINVVSSKEIIKY